MKSYIVLGLGRFGQAVAAALFESGNEVLAVDKDENLINEIQGSVTHAVIGDCSDEAVLKSLGVRNFDAAIVAVGEDIRTSIMTTVLLKEEGVRFIAARAVDELHGRILTKVGADRIIRPEHDMGIKFAQMLTSENVLDMIELSDSHSIVEIKCPSEWIGNTLTQLNLRSVCGITVLAVKKPSKLIVSPSPEYVFEKGDVPVIAGSNRDIEKLSGKA